MCIRDRWSGASSTEKGRMMSRSVVNGVGIEVNARNASSFMVRSTLKALPRDVWGTGWKPGQLPAEAQLFGGRQYSPLITKYEPRIVPASFDFCRANLNELSSAGTSIPSESLNPTARFFASSSGYSTLIDSPLS